MVHICDTRCAEGDCDVILIKMNYTLLWCMWFSFIDNLSKKANHHHLMALYINYCSYLHPVFLLFYNVTHLAMTQFLKSKWVDQSVWWFKKRPVYGKFCINRDMYIIEELKIYHLRKLSSVNNHFLKPE